MTEEEIKELVLRQADMYLNGDAINFIAYVYGKRENEVRINLTERLKDYDKERYQKVMARFELNKNPVIRYPKDNSRVLEAYELFVKQGMPLEEVANALHVNIYVIIDDLTRKLKSYSECYSDIVTADMVNAVNEIFEKSIDQLGINQIDVDLLDKMYPSEAGKKKFLTKCALTFGLRLDALSGLLGVDQGKLYDYFVKGGLGEYRSFLIFLFHHGFVDQKKAIASFVAFFARLSAAYLSGDREACTNILKEISDTEAENLRKKRKLGDKVTKEDILIILKFQLKYGLSREDTVRIFNLNRNTYTGKIQQLEDKYPELVSCYHYVTDFYFQSNRRNR